MRSATMSYKDGGGVVLTLPSQKLFIFAKLEPADNLFSPAKIKEIEAKYSIS